VGIIGLLITILFLGLLLVFVRELFEALTALDLSVRTPSA
jgi:hypothetical protein